MRTLLITLILLITFSCKKDNPTPENNLPAEYLTMEIDGTPWTGFGKLNGRKMTASELDLWVDDGNINVTMKIKVPDSVNQVFQYGNDFSFIYNDNNNALYTGNGGTGTLTVTRIDNLDNLGNKNYEFSFDATVNSFSTTPMTTKRFKGKLYSLFHI